jgi:hypothetical protein
VLEIALRSWLRRGSNKALDAHADQLVSALYRILLDRGPDEAGLRVHGVLAREARWEQLLAGFVESPEFKRRWLTLGGYDWRADPAISPLLTPVVTALSARLQAANVLALSQFTRHVDEIARRPDLVVGQREYLALHTRRFHELFNVALLLLDGRPEPRILEFGVTELSRLYRVLVPASRLVTADRPVANDYPGFRPDTCRAVASSIAHASIDLERTSADSCPTLVEHGPYDLVVFTELLEHLVVHPVTVLQGLAGLLSTEGYLYLTTPNIFRRESLEKLIRRENPLPVYPRAEDNWDFHYHHREYGMAELLRFCGEASLQVRACYFSDCWDEKSPELPEDQRSNLVVVAQSRARA